MNPLQQQISSALAERYEIEREIGAGGMATVYLARDPRHARRVAVKVLNPELGAVLGVERFLSEIRVTANLQHPNLLPLFDSGEAGGLLFYVMPYVEGETLRGRLEREKQLPIDEAVRIATAVASALDYAHRHGVIHRDLKPENILLQEGQPLIADFGIALAVSNAGGARVTQTGLSLGTPQYMSPEQATGDRGIDGRTDIYSLGAVTYEMLTGEPPHSGTTAQAIIARLIAEEPRPISIQRRSVPEHVEDAVAVALQKLPADRFATAKEFSEALNGRATSTPTRTVHARRAAARRRTSPAVLAGVALAGAAVGALVTLALRPRAAERPVEFLLDATGPARYTPSGGQNVAFAPDGKSIIYIAAGTGNGVLMLRRLDAEQGTFLPGTERAQDPMYSPDSRRIAFHRNGRIYTMPLDGTPTELATIGAWEGITWVNDRTIAYESSDTIWAIDATTAVKRVVTTGNRAAGEMNLATPVGLPDGRTIAFFINMGGGAGGKNVLAFASVDGSNRTVTDIAGRATIAYMDGRLVYEAATGGGVMALPFDVASRKAKGEPIRLADTTLIRSKYGTAMSNAGDVVYTRGSRERQLVLLGPSGDLVDTAPDHLRYAFPAWSPDGSRIAYQAQMPGDTTLSLWIYDTKSRTTARLETGGNSFRPTWTPDGKRIAYIRGNARVQEAYILPADGSAPPTLLSAAAGKMVREVAFTPDGKSAVITVNRADAPKKQDIALLPLDGSAPVPLVATAADENQPVVSPDGRWVAYMSTASGRQEVYVQRLHGSGSAMISRGGGSGPRWTRGGRIIYIDPGGTFRRVELTTVGGLPAPGRRDSLFTPNVVQNAVHQTWDVTGDGRIVAVRVVATSDQIVVSTDWWRRQLARLGR